MNNEEAKEKFNAINNRSREKLGEIIEIASKACVDTVHPGGYEPGQYGQDYRTFGAAIGKIRQICKKDLSGDFPDYEWMAGMMMHDEFKPERLAQEIEALASEKPIDYPTFFTPGWLVEIAKWLAANGTASGQQQGKPTDDELNEAATEEPTTVGCPSLAPGKVVVHDEPAEENEQRKAQSEQQREVARQKRKISWKVYATKVDVCVMGKTQQNGKVYEVRIGKRQTDVSDTYAQCKVNGKVVLTCSFTGGAWMLKRILTAGMQELVNYKALKKRQSRFRNAKRVAAELKAKKGSAK